jgi:hypothetical protein
MHKLKHHETNSVHPYSLRAFQQFQEHDKRHRGGGAQGGRDSDSTLEPKAN